MKRLLPFLAAVLLCAPAHAQDPDANSLSYVQASIENVSDALFKKGILKTTDPAAIEEYVRIHQCGIYEQYQRDDFSWGRIREAQARDLESRLNALPDGLEVTNIIRITQYDMNTNQFMLDPKSVLNNVGFLTVFHEPSGYIKSCDYPFVPRVHPLSLIMKIDTPVTLTGIPMSQQDATNLLNEINLRRGPDEERRNVMLVFRVRLTGIDPLTASTDLMHRTVLGELDDIRVYEGANRKTLLFRKVFENPQGKSGKN